MLSVLNFPLSGMLSVFLPIPTNTLWYLSQPRQWWMATNCWLRKQSFLCRNLIIMILFGSLSGDIDIYFSTINGYVVVKQRYISIPECTLPEGKMQSHQKDFRQNVVSQACMNMDVSEIMSIQFAWDFVELTAAEWKDLAKNEQTNTAREIQDTD